MNTIFQNSIKSWLLFLIVSNSICWAADRPNVVWIVSEDNSHHYLKHFFPDGIPTPQIEAMAAHGLTYDHAFSNSPVCSVARTTLATSCFGPRIGTQFHRRSEQATLPDGLQMFPAYLREAGYYTTNNSKEDYNAGPSKGVWDESSKKASWRNRSETSQPFFHMESHAQSHESSLHFSKQVYDNHVLSVDPKTVQLADYFPDTPLFRFTHAYYLERMQIIDSIVGDTLSKLKEDGLLEETFVFYFGDHGGVLPRGKGYIYESGLHVPLVVRVPEKWKHLVDAEKGSRINGFVSFVDFGPTVLNLAGVEVPSQVDGKPFLGNGITTEEVNQRNEAFGYADRFDEKYDFMRSLRKGRFQYIRSFQPFLPDGLQNNYRYQMLAYQEWRDLYKAGKLNAQQQQFFQAKPVEMLFDVEADPHEVHNLAKDSDHQKALIDLRTRLNKTLRTLPDLSYYPESHLISVMNNPVAFGKSHQSEIGELADIADLALVDFVRAKTDLQAALNSDNPWKRYWAAMTCSAFGEQAKSFEAEVEHLLNDESLHVQMRAAEFLGFINVQDPQPLLRKIINSTDNPVLATEALNSVVYFQDHHSPPYPCQVETLKPIPSNDGTIRRIDFLSGDPERSERKKNKK